MTAYLSRGDTVILYAGTLNVGALNGLIEKLRDEGVEVLPPLVAGREPAGPPSVFAVIEAPEENCKACGWPNEDDASRGRGLTLDGAVIVDEVSRMSGTSNDCPRTDPHYPHTWPATVRGSYYCKGVLA
jgi:hypothetical protein